MRGKSNDIETVKKINLQTLMSEWGCKKTYETSRYKRYLSPFRTETEGSLVVYNNIPSYWKDYGDGSRGDIIDFIKKLHNVNFKTAIELLLKSKGMMPHLIESSSTGLKSPLKTIHIKHVSEIENPSLLDYLNSRGIEDELARLYTKQVSYYNEEKGPDHSYFAIGFQNNKRGWDLRSPHRDPKKGKYTIPPKYWTTIKGQNKGSVSVFEGFISFLSALAHYGISSLKGDVIVLNTIAFAKYVYLGYYKEKYLFLDNDPSGDKETKRLLDKYPDAKDYRKVYKGYNDFNDFLLKKKS